jgi:hypothetical protein
MLIKTGEYAAIGEQVGGLVAEKQIAYGDMIRGAQDLLRILYPDGIKPEQYADALLILRILDKIGRLTRGNKKAFDESPWRDICGYAILGAEQDERNNEREEIKHG